MVESHTQTICKYFDKFIIPIIIDELDLLDAGGEEKATADNARIMGDISCAALA